MDARGEQVIAQALRQLAATLEGMVAPVPPPAAHVPPPAAHVPAAHVPAAPVPAAPVIQDTERTLQFVVPMNNASWSFTVRGGGVEDRVNGE
jgi:hypothetical protein